VLVAGDEVCLLVFNEINSITQVSRDSIDLHRQTSRPLLE